MSEPTTHPLCWPEGWRRIVAANRKNPQFRQDGKPLSVATACDRVEEQLEQFNASNVVISTNIEPTLSGRPRSSKPEPADPGVAVYWEVKGQKRCMAIDRYVTVAGNLAALAATLDAMRAIDRHGSAEILDRAFTGFAQLPPPSSEAWWVVLDLERNAKEETIRSKARLLLGRYHPDSPYANPEEYERVQTARDQALEALKS